ncbi:thioredoxin family protein [Paenibacillus sediminis]|uniref:Thiol-disulfide isomerase/thioredoxin n=1 Tax=Paenibacillus sediminis TaxID=664909 RepID=A0ABS4H0E6_9BACL|nr:thioredoxin family protein [Paenibacillus sediminis]MBP1936000.1 thiol-disulfide isomerase/thioredoxin [Paenibacillus sediminis]
MQFVNQLEELKETIGSSQVALLFIKTSNCAVCESVYPKTEQVLSSYPSVHGVAVSMEEVPEASGEYLAFAAPTIILFVEGKEVYRQSRFIMMKDLEHNVSQWVEAMAS